MNCAGPWSSEMTGIKVRPIKGYLVSFESEFISKMKYVIIHRNSIRILKRKDGTLVAVGMMEDSGFDRDLKEENLMTMRKNAITIIPKLSDGQVIENYSGFRPKGEGPISRHWKN